MGESAKNNLNLGPNVLQDDQSSARLVDYAVGNSPPRPSPVAIPQQSEQGKVDDGKQSKEDYISSLCRSIKQMTNGDVQPVREGLEELRRELDADAEDNPVDS